MSDRELYELIISQHDRDPNNFGPFPEATHTVNAYNPICGDRFQIRFTLENGIIRDIRFQGRGCALSKASASIMTSMVHGTSSFEAEALCQDVRRLVEGGAYSMPEEALGDLVVLSGVGRLPFRVRCARLAWDALYEWLQSDRLSSV